MRNWSQCDIHLISRPMCILFLFNQGHISDSNVPSFSGMPRFTLTYSQSDPQAMEQLHWSSFGFRASLKGPLRGFPRSFIQQNNQLQWQRKLSGHTNTELMPVAKLGNVYGNHIPAFSYLSECGSMLYLTLFCQGVWVFPKKHTLRNMPSSV